MRRKWNWDDDYTKGRLRSVITGMGIVSSIGNNLKEFSDSLKKGKSGVSYEKPREGLPEALGVAARISSFSFESSLRMLDEVHLEIASRARNFTRRSSKSLQCSVLSLVEAWGNSGFHDSKVSAERTGIIVCGSNISQNFNYNVFRKFEKSPEYVSPSYSLQFMDTDHVGTMSEIFGISGESFTVGGASASGNLGIIKAMQMIELDLLDACLVVGPLTEISDVERMGFYNLGAIGGKSFNGLPEKVCRPFDKKHDGFIYGEGSACIVVESLKSARSRGQKILAELVGGAVVLDANRLSNPNEDGEVKAMIKALERAGVDTTQVDYINAHGTSTPMGDITEAKAISRVLGNEVERVLVNSTKSLTGHCLFSAGVIEAVATVVQANENFVHPNLNLEEPIDIQLNYCPDICQSAEIDIAISNSYGFGGINTSIIIKRGVEL